MDIPQESSGGIEADSNSKKTSDEPAVLSPNALKAILTECLSSWVHYLQVLNNLCSAGFKLSQCLGSLAQFQTIPLAAQCQASWEELAKATIIASNTVKTHIAATMQDMVIGETYTESDAQRQQEHNQHIIFENLLTFINLQYQFSIASCEYFGPVATCPCCQTVSGGVHDPDCSMAALQQCFARLYTQDTRSQTSSPHSAQPGTLDSPKTHFEGRHLPVGERGSSPSQAAETRGSSPLQGQEIMRGHSPVQSFIDTIRSTVTSHIENLRGPFPTPGQLHTMKSPFLRGSRSPLHFPLFPLSSQRRWSEAAACDVGVVAAAGDGGDSTMRRWSMPWDCARDTTSTWHGRMLAPGMKLVVPTTHDRSRSNTPVESAACHTSITGSDGLAEAIQLLGSRGMRTQSAHVPQPQVSSLSFGVPSMWPTEAHPEDRMHKRLHWHRNWPVPDITQGASCSVTEHYDVFPTNVPLTSRKSSSSTDSSSCLSIHSRSTSGSERGSSSDGGGGEAMRLHTHLYSIWSGSDHLPFIRLPESQEPPDDSEDCDNESGSLSAFPKPT